MNQSCKLRYRSVGFAIHNKEEGGIKRHTTASNREMYREKKRGKNSSSPEVR
jgi:hypothetical protein